MFLLPNVTVAERSVLKVRNGYCNLILRTLFTGSTAYIKIKLSICCVLLFNDTFNDIFSFHFTALEAV